MTYCIVTVCLYLCKLCVTVFDQDKVFQGFELDEMLGCRNMTGSRLLLNVNDFFCAYDRKWGTTVHYRRVDVLLTVIPCVFLWSCSSWQPCSGFRGWGYLTFLDTLVLFLTFSWAWQAGLQQEHVDSLIGLLSWSSSRLDRLATRGKSLVW